MIHNTGVVIISLGSVNICYLGMAQKIDRGAKFDDLGTVHYLIIPVGDGENFPDWKKVSSLISEVDPGVIIPSCYKMTGSKKPYGDLKKLEEFSKELGVAKVEEEKKLKLQAIASSEESQIRLIALDVMKS